MAVNDFRNRLMREVISEPDLAIRCKRLDQIEDEILAKYGFR